VPAAALQEAWAMADPAPLRAIDPALEIELLPDS
jgi:hypothetical protein